MFNIFLYFGRNYIILSFNNIIEKIKYKNYYEKQVLDDIIKYCKYNYIYEIIIISNRLYYKINNIYNKDVNISWKIESKNRIKEQIKYINIEKILKDSSLFC